MSKQVTITAKVEKGDFADRSAAVTANVPATVAEAAEMWGEDVAYSQMMADYTVGAQSVIRSLIKKGLDANAIQAQFGMWKPGVKRAGVSASPDVLLDSALASMDDEAKEAFVAKLRARLGL